MSDPLASTGERKLPSVSTVLLLQSAVATVGGAWGGWITLPYDLVVLLLVLCAFVILAVTALIRAIKHVRSGCSPAHYRWTPIIVVIAMQPIAYSALVSASRAFDRFGNHHRFELNRVRYDRIIDGVEQRSWPAGIHYAEVDGSGIQVDVSDAVRIQLSSDGYFGNWESVIHDPSNAVGGVETPNRNLGPERLRRLFGDFRLGRCEKLSGDYYFCEFG